MNANRCSMNEFLEMDTIFILKQSLVIKESHGLHNISISKVVLDFKAAYGNAWRNPSLLNYL